MSEKVVLPPPEEISLYPRRKPTVPPEEYWPYVPDADLVPPMASAGEGYRFHVTGLTHDERGYPVMTAEAHEKLVRRLIAKIEQNSGDIIEIREENMADAEVVVCAYGITARIARFVVELARREGIKAGFLKLTTVWPFPELAVRRLAKKVKAIIVPEINSGQIVREVERCAAGRAKVLSLPLMGGAVHKPEDILDAVRGAI